MKLSLESTIDDILKNKAAVKVIDEIIPGIIKNPLLRSFSNQSILSLTRQYPGYVSEEALEKIREALEQIEE